MTAPIDLYYWPTPNGWKVSIMLEECGLPYTTHYVDIGAGDQFKPDFLRIAPNNRMPAIVDPDGPGCEAISVFESGAILLYLGRKTGKFYPPSDERHRVMVEEWLMWQMGGLGPMLGQNHHFGTYAPEKIPYAIKRYQDETHRLYGVLDRRLEGRDFIADLYSIADMASIGWVQGWERQGIDLAEFPNLAAWKTRMEERPAVAKGLALGAEKRKPMTDEDKKRLFGQRADNLGTPGE